MSTGCEPLIPGVGIKVHWTVPREIEQRADIDTVRIYRSPCENYGYVKIDDIPYTQAKPTKEFFDSSGTRRDFYLVTFVASTTGYESAYHITYFRPSPKEAKLIDQIRRATPQVIQETMTSEDFLNGLRLAVQIFNAYPPQTAFTLEGFPRNAEFFLIGLGQLTSLTSRFLPLSIRDWRYSEPGGIVMDINRGEKIQAAMEIITKTYTQYLPLVKLDYSAEFSMGLGTVQLPISMGGVVSRGLLNILDVFTATGR
jgi:hypothetical protein